MSDPAWNLARVREYISVWMPAGKAREALGLLDAVEKGIAESEREIERLRQLVVSVEYASRGSGVNPEGGNWKPPPPDPRLVVLRDSDGAEVRPPSDGSGVNPAFE
jgi:hypothetical protein